MDTKIDNHIADFRKEHRITQEELAAAVNVTRQTIISLENGKYIASLPLAFRLAKYFGTTIEELFVFDSADLTSAVKKEVIK